jgi:hypothetical protein
MSDSSNLRRSLLVLALCCAAPFSALPAQVCAGFAALDGTRYRVSASAASHRYADALGTSITAGHRVFGTLGVARAYDEEVDASAYDVGLEVGADVSDRRRRVFLCPVVALSVSFGPQNFLLNPNHDFRRIGGALGLGVAGVAWRGRHLAVHPTVEGRAVHLRARESYSSGYHSDRATYFLVSGGVGLVINDVLTIRPGISVPFGFPPAHPDRFAVPFGREEQELSFELAVGINFGRRTPRAAGR